MNEQNKTSMDKKATLKLIGGIALILVSIVAIAIALSYLIGIDEATFTTTKIIASIGIGLLVSIVNLGMMACGCALIHESIFRENID